MKKGKAILDRRNNKITPYQLAGKIKTVPNVGQFSSLLQRIWENDGEVFATYKLSAITVDFVYYIDETDGDEASSIIMLNRQMKLVSNNIFAANDLWELVERNDGLLWMSKAVKYWQREQFVTPRLLIPAIKAQLGKVKINDLTEEESEIYFAYRNNGPVKYSRVESLMAVLLNDSGQKLPSAQIAEIRKMLEVK